jgi:hypothetical protein
MGRFVRYHLVNSESYSKMDLREIGCGEGRWMNCVKIHAQKQT